jgi:glycosyltransferase involved in cell wall biosynthesis
LYEGLGLVLVEAQAAGLPCVISDVIPNEADVVSNLVARMPLACSEELWGEKILKCAGTTRYSVAMEQFRYFDIEYSVDTLENMYCSSL